MKLHLVQKHEFAAYWVSRHKLRLNFKYRDPRKRVGRRS